MKESVTNEIGKYNSNEIDAKWQKIWENTRPFQPVDFDSRPKYYVLDMFPYPSGSGLHVGHMSCYTPTDVISRYKRAQGYNVLHPTGYDAFGLPAEQYAIQTGIHPAITTNNAIDHFRSQLKSFGFSYNWDGEISTCDPSYYKWTQYIFTLLYNKGLAYQKEVPVNWCPALRTVLANEEVVDGKSERGNHPVIRMPMKQWMLKITDYAERLLQDLDKLDWPERTKEGQRNWIGKSVGANVTFRVATTEKSEDSSELQVFTTRPDTLFGVTFMVLAPEHPWVQQAMKNPEIYGISETQKMEVLHYIQKTMRKSDVDRKAFTEKTGVFSGAYAIHPIRQITNTGAGAETEASANAEKIPIWISDYVLMDYGTGAIMAVPAHDERDHEFALKFQLPIRRVLEGGDLPFVGEGTLVNSDFINGLSKQDAIEKMIRVLEEKKMGQRKVHYKLRDWLFSRQRYWGEPFPIIHSEDGKTHALSLSELPVLLPEVADYEPSEAGEAPLARRKDWVRYSDKAQRETDTMPGSAGSSWYFLRYTDPKNDQNPFTFEKQKYWMPVDLYMGGPEHTVGHLLYARFWTKVLFDLGLVSYDEPFQKLIHQGMILGPDGEKMSKSRGNTINPDEVRSEYGADAVRCYLCFLGPLDKDKPWSTQGIEGVRRFLDRVWRWVVGENIASPQILDLQPIPNDLDRLLHRTIKKVTEDIESYSFNTAISAMMILLNEIYKSGCRNTHLMKTFVQLLMPFAPHLSEELWLKMGATGLVSLALWPPYDENKIRENKVVIAVQVLGKTRGTIELTLDCNEADALEEALKLSTVKAAIKERPIKKVIYKTGKILNLIPES